MSFKAGNLLARRLLDGAQALGSLTVAGTLNALGDINMLAGAGRIYAAALSYADPTTGVTQDWPEVYKGQAFVYGAAGVGALPPDGTIKRRNKWSAVLTYSGGSAVATTPLIDPVTNTATTAHGITYLAVSVGDAQDCYLSVVAAQVTATQIACRATKPSTTALGSTVAFTGNLRVSVEAEWW